MGRRIVFFTAILFLVVFEIQQFFVSQSQIKPTEVTHEATSTAQIVAGEVASVAYVIDGDTIELTDGRRVRYIGIDAPENEKCFSEQSGEENKTFVDGKAVRLEKDISETDAYGRLLRYVYVNDTFVNEQLVSRGFASAWNVPPDERYKDIFITAQREAIKSNNGLWQACRK